MRQVLAMVLVLSILTQQVMRLALMANYELNKEYIAKNLCEKKDIPDSCCEGSCHLKKQLEEEDKKESTPANPFKEKFEVQDVIGYETLQSGMALQLSQLAEGYKMLISSPHLLQVFHPPCSVLLA